MSLRHFLRDAAYVDVRRFKLPSGASPVSDCALIRRHLSNSHISEFLLPETDYRDTRFSLRMLAALVDGNVSLGALRLDVVNRFTPDYPSLGTVFGGRMRMDTFEMRAMEHDFVRLVKATDFLRQPTIQGLKKLKLDLVRFQQGCRGFGTGTRPNQKSSPVGYDPWLRNNFRYRLCFRKKNCSRFETRVLSRVWPLYALTGIKEA